MSRTTLCLTTAGLLALLSIGIMSTRRYVLGQEIVLPAGPGTYKVTLLVRGKSQGNAKVQTLCPLDYKQQHVFREEFTSEEMTQKPVEGRGHDLRPVLWTQKSAAKAAFQLRYEFYCSVDVHSPTAPMAKLARQLNEPPQPGEYVHSEAYIDPNDQEIGDLAITLTENMEKPMDQARALFNFVADHIDNEPAITGAGTGALECLHARRGDAAAKARLLAALCRNRGIPTRLVTGLRLAKRTDQTAHFWVEAWVGDHWISMCSVYHHCGNVPPSYLVFGHGDLALVRGHNVRDIGYACLVEHKVASETAPAQGTWLQRVFRIVSLDTAPPDKDVQNIIKFLLLLPVAALIICICRNLIGMHCFGTFAPALIGLAFREWESLPGILVFVSIVLIGWGLRRVLDHYHLLQVPRSSFLLSTVVLLLLGFILIANQQELTFTRYFSLFPMVILTGMIERFWTLETEDSTTASFKTLLQTIIIAALISLTASRHVVVRHLMHYPETLGLIMAAQLAIGRYTGYRLSELLRFRDFVQTEGV